MVGPAVTPGRCVCTCWHWAFSVDDGVHGSSPHGSQGRTDGGARRGGGRDETTAASAAATSRGAFTHTWTPSSRRGRGSELFRRRASPGGEGGQSQERVRSGRPRREAKDAGMLSASRVSPGGPSRGCKGIISAALPCHHMPVDDEGRRGETGRLTKSPGPPSLPPLRTERAYSILSLSAPGHGGRPPLRRRSSLCQPRGDPQGWKGIRMDVCLSSAG